MFGGIIMITIRVCVGSACHLKGSYEVIKKFQDLIDSFKISDKVEIKGSFCLGHCSTGVSVKLNEGQIYSVSPDAAENFFRHTVLGGYFNEDNELLRSKL